MMVMLTEAQPAVMCFGKKTEMETENYCLTSGEPNEDNNIYSMYNRTIHLIVPYGLLSQCDKSNAERLEVVTVLSKFCFFWSF